MIVNEKTIMTTTTTTTNNDTSPAIVPRDEAFSILEWQGRSGLAQIEHRKRPRRGGRT